MDHIIEGFGLSQRDVPPVPDLAENIKDFPKNWETFQSYPRKNGWRLEEATYKLKLLPNYNSKSTDALVFLQSWLFFGLIMTIVQQDGQPLLKRGDLVNDLDRCVTTKELPEALRVWREWEQGQRKAGKIPEIRLRMVRVEAVLDAARRTIRANFSHGSGIFDDKQIAESDEVALSLQMAARSDKVALSLMILGESLSLFKTQIMKTTQSELQGWHSEDGSGWGPPAYVFNKMVTDDWCLRTMHLWRSQFRANATLLLASYVTYNFPGRFKGKEHGNCTEQDCKVTPKDENGVYHSAHAYACKSCKMQGPNMTVIRGLLAGGSTPLLRFKHPPIYTGPECPYELSIEEKDNHSKYATISHVWSDGFGNEKGNELHFCQLRHIKSILDTLGSNDGWRTSFWMDTLIIPVGHKEDKNLRRNAIKQIFTVFKDSAYTIVLDPALSRMQLRNTDKPAYAAMGILGSSWMRRLWTLQEAFLSRKIFFAFEGAHEKPHMKGLEELSQGLRSGNDTDVTAALLDMVNGHLQNMIMSHEHETRDKYLFQDKKYFPSEVSEEERKMPRERTALLVASSWNAARWRTTSNAFHETLALATLLDLDYENSNLGEAGLQQITSGDKDVLVKEFWMEFNKRWPQGIPPGIIFLPGERVDCIGFGWAPRTWMNARPVDHPDPMALMPSTAELGKIDESVPDDLNGLKVRYPGFILHPWNRNDVLGTDSKNSKFWFPTGPSFLDWYVVEPTDDSIPQSFMTAICESQDRLAIILSRAKPGDAPAEIGLLVQIREARITKEDKGGSPGNAAGGHEPSVRSKLPINGCQKDSTAGHLFCEIVRRVKVSRELRAEFRTKNRARFLGEDEYQPRNMTDWTSTIPEVMTDSGSAKAKTCLAEELGPDQVWYVDGYFPARHQQTGSSEVSNVDPPPKTPRSIWSVFAKSGPSMERETNDAGPPPSLSTRNTMSVEPTRSPSSNRFRGVIRSYTGF